MTDETHKCELCGKDMTHRKVNLTACDDCLNNLEQVLKSKNK